MRDQELYFSIYLGIVVQNNDPEHRGRIKVWVPYITNNVYNKWNQLKTDQTFAVPGSPGGENLSNILPQLRDELPWAEFVSPIIGQSATGYYNAASDTNSVSDAPLIFGQPGTNFSNTASANSLDPENKGGKPGAVYESNPVSDAFGNTSKILSQYANENSSTYKPSTYSNAAKGVFSIPNVGAHVWVFFKDGMPMHPRYFGAAFGQEDFNSIFKSGDGSYPDYPGVYENKSTNVTSDNSTYRNKMVINQRGAAIEIINTTDRESYKVTHFGGGYYELNNAFTSLFNPKNLQLLTLADKFETVNGNNSTFVGRDNDYIVQGDHWLKVGNFNFDAINSWYESYSQLSGVTDPTQIQSILTKTLSAITPQEKQMGFGGNSFEFIAKHKVITVGLVQNTAQAYTNVPDLVNGLNLVTSVSPNIAAGYFQPITEIIAPYKELFVPDMPGGNLDIFATSRFKVQSGAGGASIQTTGNLKMMGGIVDVRGDQINVGANGGQVSIDGSVVTINGDSLVLKSNLDRQVVVDSTLGVSKNVIIGGGAYVEGELFVNHITAPIEYQVTENTQIVAQGPVVNEAGLTGQPAGGWNIIGADPYGTIGVIIPELKVFSGASQIGATQPQFVNLSITTGTITLNSLGTGMLTIAQPHSHVFKNIPLTLKNKPAVNGVVVPGPNEFNTYAASVIGSSDAVAINAEPRFDGRVPTVGVPPPSLYSVGVEGSPINYPNGPGSNVAGPAMVPGT